MFVIVAVDGIPAIVTDDVPTALGVLNATAMAPEFAVAGPDIAPPVATSGTDGPNEQIEAIEGEIVIAAGVEATFTVAVVLLVQPRPFV